ncbi:MAG TPA: indole-3-glycerol phosphate synthase TrpC [Terriglobales bacterium]|nr:indole-3-glycerol phosphate synthase TrpC [Terriglobales bacterium]
MPAFLDEIIARKRARVAEAKQTADLRVLAAQAERHQVRGFRKSLLRAAESGTAVIAELKKASPSKGVIRATLHVGSVAHEFERAGAAALSVLTEEDYFQGSLANLREASVATNLPCLRKDFIVDEFQLLEAKANRADAVLLIAAALSFEDLQRLYVNACGLGLDVLCEVHNELELQRALAAGCDIVGVNSRDLRTFQVDLDTPLKLARRIPDDVLRVAESGIHSRADIDNLRGAGYQAFLIGESLMKADSPGDGLRARVAKQV